MKIASKLLVPTPPVGAVRVAFSTTSGEVIDDHFGWGRRFDIYDVTANRYEKAGIITFDGEELEQRGNDDKLTDKVDALEGCHLVYTAAIGGPAAARLTRKKIQPMTIRDETGVVTILEQLMAVMGGAVQPPWLAKIINGGQLPPSDRFSKYDDEYENEEE
jgi:nitrogen fixation protein NifX